MNVRAVIFDLDDTLMWDECLSRQALREAGEIVATRHHKDVRSIVETSKKVAEHLWRRHAPVQQCDALGIVAFEGMWGHFEGAAEYLRQLKNWVPKFRKEIWQETLASEGICDDDLAEEAGNYFQQRRRELQQVMPGAESLLADLRSKGIKLGLLTNGAPDLQREKIAASKLESYFDAIVVSGEIGIGKPASGIFEFLLKQLNVAAGETLMVGNSLSRDVLGGKNAGLKTCWLALEGEDEPVGLVEPDITIRKLHELISGVG